MQFEKGSGGSFFDDPVVESAFLADYRGAALNWPVYAFLVGALLCLCFLGIAWVTEPNMVASLYLRSFLAVFLLAVAYSLYFHWRASLRSYVFVVGSASAIGLGAAIWLQSMQVQSVSGAVIQASPTIMFGLFLHYAFLRLPLRVAACIGWPVGVASVIWSPMISGDGEFLRHTVHIVFANIFGMTICRLIELRERELFFQRRQAETARAEARERQLAAEEADRQKTRLIAAVSHDLRQPMTAAVAHLDVLQRRVEKGDFAGVQQQAEKAQAAVGILGSTLDHLLTAARYDSGSQPLRVEPIELAPLFRDLYDAYSGEAAQRGIELRVRMPPDRVQLMTDWQSMHRILANLISNAIKFTDPKNGRAGGVLVVARMRGGECRIDVVDTGIGIAAECHDEIWKPYVQLDAVERDRGRGLGLGLFLVRRIVDQLPAHSISMRSRPGRGSRFVVSLPGWHSPATPVHAAPPEASSARANVVPLNGAYVLLLEDDRDTRVSLTALLAEWGVLVAASATLGDLLAQHEGSERTVDAIICDYRLGGGVNGIDAIAGLRTRLGYAPAAALITGEAVIEQLRAMAGPDTTVLHKPFTSDALACLLLKAVEDVRRIEAG
jgi:signal transduction histidine kinase/CheY-like chemotaxis protein